jgi:hypothetical protein
MANIFPLYPDSAAQAVTVTDTTQEIAITGQIVTLTCATAASVATLAPVPVGVVFQLLAAITSSGAMTLTTAGNETIILDTNADKVSLMSIANDKFQVIDPGIYVVNSATGTAVD